MREQAVFVCSGNEVDSWDPMAADYKSRNFNSYETGAGALMQAARDRGGKEGEAGENFTLYVTNIPENLSKVCVQLTNFLSHLKPSLSLSCSSRKASESSLVEQVKSREPSSNLLFLLETQHMGQFPLHFSPTDVCS